MTTSNKSENRKIDKKDLKKIFWRSLPLEFSWHYERQQHLGFEFMMTPVLKKLYGNDKAKLSAALKRHLEFFNVTPALSPFIGGITAAMEEKNAETGEEADESAINTVKTALMGPLSGIGDSVFWGTLRVIAIGIGTAMAINGNLLGTILFLLVYNIPNFLVRYFGAMKGYQFGTDFLEKVQKSGLMDKIIFAASILGIMVVGGMTNSLITVSTPITFGVGKAMTKLQDVFDGILPGLLSLGFFGVFYYLNKKKVNVLWTIIGTVVFGIICAAFGILKV